MRLPLSFLAASWLCLGVAVVEAGERVDPAGISGALVISGGSLPDEALDKFHELAGGKEMRVVLLRLDGGESSKKMTVRILDKCKENNLPVPVVAVSGRDEDPGEIIPAVNAATGVWLLAQQGRGLKEGLGSPGLRAAVTAVIKRGGVVGGCGAVSAGFAGDGLGLLPGSLIHACADVGDDDFQLAEVLRGKPSLVGYEIGGEAALIVRGRRVTVAGRGEVGIHLAAATGRKAKCIVLKGRDAAADLSALRFAAIARSKEPFPAAKPPLPRLDHGTLIIIGGGAMPRGIISEFMKKAGGNKASIVVLPTAVADPVPVKLSIADSFRGAGAKEVTILPGRTREKVESEEYLKALRKATGIWFGGGRQWRFADAYLDTGALNLMHDVLARGGVIMGSSAGASIQADYLARANPLGNRDIIAEGYERGLGFIRGVAIDQHFAQRNRFKDMSLLVRRYPQLLGIGIDEGTALIFEGQAGRVVGSGRVHFYDRRKPVINGKPDYESVGAGGRYELVRRRILDPGKQ
ncbi:MAG: cyanophycinase [Verrucomicrobiales bacterium]